MAINKIDLATLACALVLAAANIYPAYAGDNSPVLRPTPFPVDPADSVDMDSASTQPTESDAAAKNAEPEKQMQTIDSDSEPQVLNKNVAPEPVKTTEPEVPPTPIIDTETAQPAEPETLNQSIQPEPSKAAESNPAEETAPPPKKDRGKEAAQFIEHLPQRLVFFTAGAVVGAPTLFVRKSVQYTASDTKELVGDHTNPVLVVPAGTLSLPYALSSGLIEGTVFGITNSWKHSADGHLSKASFGLDKE